MKGPEPEKIQSLFDSIATDYDKLNHLLSLGIDRSWRRRALKHIVDGHSPLRVLDIACGTGDFSIAIAKKGGPSTYVTGLDLSNSMLEVMMQKVAAEGMTGRICSEQGNSENMHYGDDSFDRATIAFGIRNFENREEALREILRVLKTGGKLIILELSVPLNTILRWCFNIYFNLILPQIGGAISGNKAAYKYLPASVMKFPGKEEWMATMQDCGFKNVKHKAFTFGICRMYIGNK